MDENSDMRNINRHKKSSLDSTSAIVADDSTCFLFKVLKTSELLLEYRTAFVNSVLKMII